MQLAQPASFAHAPTASTPAHPNLSSMLRDALDRHLPSDAEASRSTRGLARKLGIAFGVCVLSGVAASAGIALDGPNGSLTWPLIVVAMIFFCVAAFAGLFALLSFFTSFSKGNDELRARLLGRDYHGVHVQRQEVVINGFTNVHWAVVIQPRVEGTHEPITLRVGADAAGGELEAHDVATLLTEYLYSS